MRIPSRFTLAIHVMLCIAHFHKKYKITSDFLAKSTSANPVIIRRILGQLKKEGLVEVRAGVGGAFIPKKLEEISLFDIFLAVDAMEEEYFHVHKTDGCPCKLGENIQTILASHLREIQQAMNAQMRQTTLKQLFVEADAFLDQDHICQ